MNPESIMFYFISALILFFGFLSVTTTKIFRAAIYLLFSLICIAGLYFILQFEFIAAVQIIVYAGGIVVLIIFSIFLTQRSGEEMPLPKKFPELAAFTFSFLGFGLAFLQINKEQFIPASGAHLDPGVANIGTAMLEMQSSGFVLPFEVAGILLLVSMIGAIVIALKVRPTDK